MEIKLKAARKKKVEKAQDNFLHKEQIFFAGIFTKKKRRKMRVFTKKNHFCGYFYKERRKKALSASDFSLISSHPLANVHKLAAGLKLQKDHRKILLGTFSTFVAV